MKKFLLSVLIVGVCVLIVLSAIDLYVVKSSSHDIVPPEDSSLPSDFDCIIVLGCGVWGSRPSPMLEDRLKTAIELYKAGVAPKIIMSGDHGQTDYDEVNVMKSYAVENGVPSADIFMDHAGFSTYDTVYRAKEIFGVQTAVIVTQKYHLYRALFIARRLGIEARGVSADLQSYSKQFYRDVREFAARNKDFITCIFKPKPKFLGDKIPVSGNGNETND